MTISKKSATPAVAETSLVLRVCRSDHTSHDGFAWPKTVGEAVAAPDWRDNKECGNGLHAWLFGQGEHSCVDYWRAKDAKWYVLEVPSDSIVMLGGKCKFPRAIVRFIGSPADAAAYLVEHEPRAQSAVVIGISREVGDAGVAEGGALSTLTGGDYATLTGGYAATLTGGHGATLTGGHGATLTGGDRSTMTGGQGATLTGGHDATLTGGNYATLTGGDRSTLTGGYAATMTGGEHAILTGGNRSTLTGGNDATLTGGDRSTLTGGNYATLTGGDRSTLTGGNDATLTGGDRSTLTGGERSELRIRRYDDKAGRYRTAIAYVGEDGIKPGVAYQLDVRNKFVEASK